MRYHISDLFLLCDTWLTLFHTYTMNGIEKMPEYLFKSFQCCPIRMHAFKIYFQEFGAWLCGFLLCLPCHCIGKFKGTTIAQNIILSVRQANGRYGFLHHCRGSKYILLRNCRKRSQFEMMMRHNSHKSWKKLRNNTWICCSFGAGGGYDNPIFTYVRVRVKSIVLLLFIQL